MLRIGEFSVLSTISIYMLRNYDKIGLLVPDHIDPISGYRYYSRQQLLTANRIVSLKTMGFGLKEIEELKDLDTAQLNQKLSQKVLEKQKDMAELQSQIQRMEQMIQQDNAQEEYALSIIVKQIPRHKVVSYRGRIREFWDEGQLWEALTKQCTEQKIRMASLANAAAVWHEINQEENYKEIEVQLEVDEIRANTNQLIFYEVPEITAATILFQGSYMQIASINLYVARWIEENHYELRGKIFCIYHTSPKEASSEEEQITEICYPIQRREV